MIILNEHEYAIERLQTGTPGENVFVTLQILAKYYHWKCNYGPTKIEKSLIQFLNAAYPEYHVKKWQWEQTVERLSRRACKYQLCEASEIWVTENELKTIRAIPDDADYKYQKLAFTYLVLAKFYNLRRPNNNSWVNTEVREVFNMANVKVSDSERYMMLGRLDRLGITEDPKRNDNLSSRVTFVDDESEKVLSISDFRDLGCEYLMFLGKGYIRCVGCGRIVKDNRNHTKKYCDVCAGNVPIGEKRIRCSDCGALFVVSAKNNRTTRCTECQQKKNKKSKADWITRKRNNVELSN